MFLVEIGDDGGGGGVVVILVAGVKYKSRKSK